MIENANDLLLNALGSLKRKPTRDGTLPSGGEAASPKVWDYPPLAIGVQDPEK